ncbi:tRNA pseudouridine(38-40) synthase TruA [Nitrospina watsonii]|uniref:tRNA pseudouridine synthase A n=1 Tax=Nitrospina watsonii TaxID=1323948 RepID=A0ABN8VWT4_9BACT|nr:tRNA pseudouridine(38-40) synthase TruA [Nitrospina watsonii]CAI2718207.1 tRNA pseudouridine(38-40) synthase [Nitrospina watsonii]
MRRLKLVLEYEGSQYHGWQFQPNGLSIQEVLEGRLETITGCKTTVIGSGRTDSGVHAEGQVAHFNTECPMTPRQFLKALNSMLPYDIVVKSVEEVDLSFHARMCATHKLYRYTLLNRDFPSALFYRQAHYVAQPLNVEAMRRAAQHLVGRHDFTSFRGSGCGARSALREIYDLRIKKYKDWLQISIEGNGFLKHMVRNIVGTLIEVGHGRLAADALPEIIASRNRGRAGPTAPARGLCLVKVFYADSPQNEDSPAEKK